MFRKVLLALGLFLLCSATGFCQSTTVSGTITDAGAQTWNNGTFNFVFVPSAVNPVGPYSWTGGTLPTNIGGSLSGTGTYSVSIPSNTAISPIQTAWTATFCPQASSPCFTVSNITITGATQTLNATPPTILINLQSAQPPVLAYTNSEISGAALGSQYFNLVSGTLQTCTAINGNNCTTWSSAGTATNATNLVGPGTVTGAYTGSGSLSLPLLNGDYVTGTTTYPATGVGLQAAITAAANLGCVYAVRATYTLSAPLTIPSNSCIYWDNATIASNGYNGDMVQSTSTSNITFRGKLILNGSAMGTGTIGQGMNFTNVNNFSFDDIEGNGATNACIEMTGTSHVRGNKVYLQNCGKSGSTTASFFIANNSTTPSTDFMIHEIEIDTPTGGAPEDCFYVSGTTATPSLRISVVSFILNGCTDSALEINFSQGVNIGKVIAQAVFNSAVLIRRGDTDVNIDSIACSGATAYKICLDIANFQTGDPSEQRISVGQVTASNASSDVVNGAAVRISNSITTSSLTNISIGTLIADTSTRGFYCTAGTTHNAHISIGNLITHNNLGDGIKMLNCDDISGGSWISFDNKVGGTADNGNAINIQAGATGNIAAVNVFDDRGGSKLQPFGFFADGTTTNWFIGVFGCQDALEVTGCLSNSGTGNEFIRKKDATDRVKFDAGTAEFSGSVVLVGLSDFASQSFGKVFEDINAANCTNGELALSAGWGTTATVTAVAGHGQTCKWTVTSSGTGQAANPTLTDTLTQPLGSATTVCEMIMQGGTGANTLINQTTLSATVPVFTFGGTPVAASTYIILRRCGP